MGLVAEEGGGAPVGYVVAARSADGRAVFVFQLHVRGDRRGRGIGTALLERFETGAARAGVERVWLLTGDRAKGFYTRFGYVQSGELLHPEATEYLRSAKSASVLVKEIRPRNGPNPGIDAKKRGKDG